MYVEDDYAVFVRYCFAGPLEAAILRSRFERQRARHGMRQSKHLATEVRPRVPVPSRAASASIRWRRRAREIPRRSFIPGSPHNPKFPWVDDAEIVGDRIAEIRPVSG